MTTLPAVIRTTETLYCIGGNTPSAVAQATRSLPTDFAKLKEQYEQHQADWQNEPEAQIRLETVEAIAQIDDPAVLPFLLRTVQQEPPWDICEEAVVRQAALDGLTALGNQPTPYRPEIVRSLVAVASDRNPRLAKNAEEILQKVYQVTPAELDRARAAPQ